MRGEVEEDCVSLSGKRSKLRNSDWCCLQVQQKNCRHELLTWKLRSIFLGTSEAVTNIQKQQNRAICVPVTSNDFQSSVPVVPVWPGCSIKTLTLWVCLALITQEEESEELEELRYGALVNAWVSQIAYDAFNGPC